MSSNTDLEVAGDLAREQAGRSWRAAGGSRLVDLTVTTPEARRPSDDLAMTPVRSPALPSSEPPAMAPDPGDALDPRVEQLGAWARTLQVLACITVGAAAVEGYLQGIGGVGGVLSKAPAALLVLTWAWVRFHHGLSLRRHPAHAWLAALGVVVLASSAVNAGEPYTLLYLTRWVSFIVLAGVLIDVCAREVPPRMILLASLAGALIAGGGALFSFFVLGNARATGPMEDPNDLAYVLMAALPLVALLRPRSTRPRPIASTAAWLAVVVLLLGAAATFSRGGLVALVALTVFLVARGALKMRTLLVTAATVALVAAAAAPFVAPLLVESLEVKNSVASENVDSRFLRWEIALRMLGSNPVFGVGPGGFRSSYMGVSHNAELAEQTPVAHEMYLEVGAELGLLGLCIFVGFIVVALRASEGALSHGADRTVVVVLQASLVAVLSASVFLSEQYYMPLWAGLAAACAMDLRSRAGPL